MATGQEKAVAAHLRYGIANQQVFATGQIKCSSEAFHRDEFDVVSLETIWRSSWAAHEHNLLDAWIVADLLENSSGVV